MASVNKVIILGNVGRDPEIRYTPTGAAVANVSIATSSRRKDKQTGETIEDTQWHRVTFYERLAEVVGEYIKKGSSVYIEGRLKYGSFEKNGVTHYTTDIVATELQMLGGRREGDQGGDRPASSSTTRQRPAPAPAAPRAAAQAGGPSGGSSGFDDMEDIPF